MNKSLLVCIAFHYSPDRIEYLERVVYNFLFNYKVSVRIIIDTNQAANLFADDRVETFVHGSLAHPFYLTWCHRRHMKENIDNYQVFMYCESDMLVPFENYMNYLSNFEILWPNYVPSFIRIEKHGYEDRVTDVPARQQLTPIEVGEKRFAALLHPYHAFWIMPQKELKESIEKTPSFVMKSDSRELAASYPMWSLRKTPLVELDGGKVSRKCYSYHLPNNYATNPQSQFGKIKPENIFL